MFKSFNFGKSLALVKTALRATSCVSTALPERMEKFSLPSRYNGSKSVWVEYIQLALEHKPLNLGQGFPDYAPPQYITDGLARVAKGDVAIHQYARGFGHPRLIEALSKLYSKLIGRKIDAENEIIVTCGAYEALYCSIIGHVDVGDEVIIIEPFFDCYEPIVRAAGGTPRFIPLRLRKTSKPATTADWVLDSEELEGMFNNKTKMIIFNTPHNPLGKVFNEAEIQQIANLCKKWNVLCISDEVYEWMVYKPNKHIRIATFPGMWERTITIGSAGKTFSVTGWKTGWAYGPANLIRNLQIVHQNTLNSCYTPIQEAVAQAFETEMTRLGKEDCYFVSLAVELQAKRDYIAKILTTAGMEVTIPEGGYFIVADWSPLASTIDLSSETDKYKDYRFTKWMTKNVGLQGIPPTAFYSESHKHLAENFVRYCFIKKDENLKKVADLLEKWKSSAK